jgi:carboxypeptidase family protein
VTNKGDAPESGIEGQISFGPLSPVARPGMANYRPYQASINVLDEQRRAVAQVQSDADGRFRVLLPPGRYVLDPKASGRRPHAAQQVVTVHPGAITPVRINYDSGIR